MPRFLEVGLEAKERLAKTSKGYQHRQVYRDTLIQLQDGSEIEVQPEPGETLRKIKVNVRRAANELGISIGHGETVDGMLLVWKETPRERGRQRRGRARTGAE